MICRFRPWLLRRGVKQIIAVMVIAGIGSGGVLAMRPPELVRGCCRRHQIDPPAGILLTQSKPPRTVSYSGVAPIWGGSVNIGSLGQKRVGANTVASAMRRVPHEGQMPRRCVRKEVPLRDRRRPPVSPTCSHCNEGAESRARGCRRQASQKITSGCCVVPSRKQR